MKHKLELKVRKDFLIIIFALIVTAALIFQGLYDWNRRNSDLTGEPLITSLVNGAVDGLNTPAPVDAQTGQVYFPDAKLMLPAAPQNLSLRQIEYSNQSAGNGSFDLQVTTAGILNESKTKLLTAQALAESEHKSSSDVLLAIFRQVPGLQSCARGAQLFYQPQTQPNDPPLKLQFTKKLNNGKTLYTYNETTCNGYDMPALVSYLKQIQSY